MVNINPNDPQVTTRIVQADDGTTSKITETTTKDGNITTTNIHTETSVPVHKDPLQSALSGENKQDKTGNALSTAAKTPEQEANLAKLNTANEFLAKQENKKRCLKKLV